jgi:hypothetical protein
VKRSALDAQGALDGTPFAAAAVRGETTMSALDAETTKATPGAVQRRRRSPSTTIDPVPEQRLLRHEAHVRGLAIWVVLAALTVTLFGAYMTLLATLAVTQGAPLVLAIIPTAIVGLGIGQAFSGVGLWRYEGWARGTVLALLGSVVVVEALYGLRLASVALAVKVGVDLAFTAPIAWALHARAGRQVFAVSYRRLLQRDRSAVVAWWRSPFFWAPIALGALAFVLAAALVVRAILAAAR